MSKSTHSQPQPGLDDEADDTEVLGKKGVRSATDIQRLKLEKLLKNPEKPAFVPERPKDKKMPKPPEFIRNTWGSSAGAGSGDFHVYRGVRRREYARQKFLDEMAEKKGKDEDFHKKVDENLKAAEERTSKKRAKRLKKKQNAKKKNTGIKAKSSSESDEESDENVGENADEQHKEMENSTENVKVTKSDEDAASKT